MKTWTLILILVLGILGPLEFVSADGNKLLRNCTKTLKLIDGSQVVYDQYDVGWCLGFVQGVQQSTVLLSSYADELGVCFPESGITNEQAIRIVLKYLNENPEQLHELETTLVILALMQAFPCDN